MNKCNFKNYLLGLLSWLLPILSLYVIYFLDKNRWYSIDFWMDDILIYFSINIILLNISAIFLYKTLNIKSEILNIYLV